MVRWKIDDRDRWMMRILWAVWFGLLLGLPRGWAEEPVFLATASSLQPRLQQHLAHWEQVIGTRIRLIAGASLMLARAIRHGAPYDLFVSASPSAVVGMGLAQKKLGHGFVGLRFQGRRVSKLEELRRIRASRIALPDPNVAPMGAAVRQVLLSVGLWGSLQPRLVFAPSALQAQRMLDLGLVDAAFVPAPERAPHLASVVYRLVLLRDRAVAKRLFALVSKERLP